jgi:hypothetical protein
MSYSTWIIEDRLRRALRIVAVALGHGDVAAPAVVVRPLRQQNGRKIEAIKIVREMTGMGLKEAKDWVEGLQSQIPPGPPRRWP